MKDHDPPHPSVSTGLLLSAYEAGVFPMADAADASEIYWVEPRQRGIIPLDRFHVSRSLARRIRKGDYQIRIDRAFDAVVDACADRDETWINAEIRMLYSALHAEGHAHSVEVWQGRELIGGLYGVRRGGAFFGESMFSRARDGSKLALAHLVARLATGGFRLLDTQFLTPHLESMGAVSVPRSTYLGMLDRALAEDGDFHQFAADSDPSAVLQAITQTS